MLSLAASPYQMFLPGMSQMRVRTVRSTGSSRKTPSSSSSSTSTLCCEESLDNTVRRVLLTSSSPLASHIMILSSNPEETREKLRESLLMNKRNFPQKKRGFNSFYTSYVSADTFDENKLSSTSFPIFRRGFKTRRSSSYVDDDSFKRKLKTFTLQEPFAASATTAFTSASSPSPKAININNPEPEAQVLTEILKNAKLDEREREKLRLAINSYAAGFSAGKHQEPFLKGLLSQTNIDDSKGGGDPSDKKGAAAGKKKFWTIVNKLSSTVVMVVFLTAMASVMGVKIRFAGKFGKNANGIIPEDNNVTFEDVKGCDEAKEELQEIVDFLKNPEKYSVLGGKLPKGVLLIGPPGTGKTLLARAVAGEATVPFFHAAGPEFDELFVGQGARRIRDLFSNAKSNAPCVVFIDEIDSVGSSRKNSVHHPYANQTVNQLLSEMDGFSPSDGVIVLGATNRASDLDKALLRPGRFDSKVVVGKPDLKGRREILRLYLQKIKHDSSVDIEVLARLTRGFSGADIENLVNTAAIRAASLSQDAVTMADFEYSHDRQVMGVDLKSRERPVEDLRITAYHEAGHTLVSYFSEQAMPLHKVTIVARDGSGGHTAHLPKRESSIQTKAELLALMDVCMGGRAAEELIFGKDKITTGASSDLENATNISGEMVTRLGMSEAVGLRIVFQNSESSDVSPATTEMIDVEINKMLNDSYKRANVILKTHTKELHTLAEALLKYETLDVEQIKAVIEGKDPSQIPAKSHNKVSKMKTLKSLSTPDSEGNVLVS